MRLLTPELMCLSALQTISVAGIAVSTRQLDFNLSRRSGILINQILSTMLLSHIGGTSPTQYLTTHVQELDLDPDNVTIWQNNSTPVAVEYDSSRLLRHLEGGSINIVTDLTYVDTPRTHLQKDWHATPLERRPLSITAMRHHLYVGSNEADSVVDGLLMIWYHIVELTLEELGILNASRR